MRVIFAVFVLVAASAAAAAQGMDKERRTEMFRREIAKAKWVPFAKDDGGDAYFVDSLTMKRFAGTVVVFLVKQEKKDGIEYTKNVGGCTKHIMATDNRLFSKPNETTLTGGAVDNAQQITLVKGTIEYSILEYVCTNAKQLKL
ncbi:MAG: hypothetical protein ACK4S4_01270 [Pyrinomonadaceae bacterium]